VATNPAYSNPYITTVGQGLFDGATSYGGTQGTAESDPATRFALRSGILSINETLPMWGGVALYEAIPGLASNPNDSLGPIMGRATTVTGGSYPIAGFSVFDQAYGMITSPQSPVPTIGSYGQVMSYRLGSGARIWLQCDPLLASLEGTAISSPVGWDLVNQQLIPSTGSINVSSGTYDGALTISSGTYNSTTGLVVLTLSAASHLVPGNTFTISGATGTGSFAQINGTKTAVATTSGATVSFYVSTGLTMTITGGTLNSGLVVLTLASAPGISVGDSFTIASVTVTGTGGTAAINGTFTAVAGTTGTTLAYQTTTGLSLTITSSTGTFTTGTALPNVSILRFAIGNSKTVNYSSSTGFATWNFAGSAALVQI